MPQPLRIGLVGPDQSQPCGIADYTQRLRKALAPRCDLVFAPFRAAEKAGLQNCHSLLVQYERSLVPDPGFLRRLAAINRRVFVVPHEVYGEDPFAFPYTALTASSPLLLWMKRMRYRWRHRQYGREQALQAMGYHAHRVIPLSPGAAETLHLKALPEVAEAILPPIPLACPDPDEFPAAAGAAAETAGKGALARREDWFASAPRILVGIFGFLNPSHDYGSALDLVQSLGPSAALLVIGGHRGGEHMGDWLERATADRGLQGRVRVTGYLPAEKLEANLALCDLFLGPLRFKSSSASLLHLFHLGKPILVSDLPLTRYLKEQGAPIEVCASAYAMRQGAADFVSGARSRAQGSYRWSFDTVAEAYLEAMRSAIP
jgi:hypothetical protein